MSDDLKIIDFYLTTSLVPFRLRRAVIMAAVQRSGRRIHYVEHSRYFSRSRAERRCLALNASIGRTS